MAVEHDVPNPEPVSRRHFLAATAGFALAGLLAACGETRPGSASARASSPAAAPSTAASKPVSGAQRELKVAFVNIAAVNAPVWLAESTGAFTEHAVRVNSQLIQSNLATKALIAKEID